MNEKVRKTIELPEITRIEGHAAVHVDIENGSVANVQLEVFEGTRFFEQLVVGHHYTEMPHITSRVCAICSTGHVLAAIFAQEAIIGFQQPERLRLYRELMHLGMIIESHATHIFALALPDFVGAADLVQFATQFPDQFKDWTQLRALGATIQTLLGGRPFHPVNLQVGGFSHYPTATALQELIPLIEAGKAPALRIAEFLLGLKPQVSRTTTPSFVALLPDTTDYGYFGTTARSTEGWEQSIANYKEYLKETVVSYSHAKRTTANGKDMMVGSIGRLLLYGDRLKGESANLYKQSRIAQGDTNSILNNLGQAIEIVEALDRSIQIIRILSQSTRAGETKPAAHQPMSAGSGVGAVECPRGTLYHSYTIDADGTILAADLVTPSVQNTGRIELDIREVVASSSDIASPSLQSNLETLVRAYDPCNTCATHMVKIRYK